MQIPQEHVHTSDRTELDPHRLTLNFGDTFAVYNRVGDIRNVGEHSQGFFYKGCRFLSRSELLVFGARPELLSSTVREEVDVLSADLTNPELVHGNVKIERGTLHIGRLKFLQSGYGYERITVQNFALQRLMVPLELSLYSDFLDLFELRGFHRKSTPGTISYPEEGSSTYAAFYEGGDGIQRRIRLDFPREWQANGRNKFRCEVELDPGESREFELVVALSLDGEAAPAKKLGAGLRMLEESLEKEKREIGEVHGSNSLFNHWVKRSKLDLVTLLSEVGGYRYPFAGVPWYNTVFGRDGIVTAIQCLLVAPEVAKNVLLFLAQNQARTRDAAFDAEPGKILHEMREGELVNLGEVPFKHYYGSVDSTPLFLWLVGLYYRRTNDVETAHKLWPHVERALEWVNKHGDMDGDGFVEYFRHSENGLTNQGWKDSHDSISHADGSLAQGPIALCEVQGYVYQAKLSIAKLAARLGKKEAAGRLEREASELKLRFNEAFWDEEGRFLALALDGKKKPLRVRTSNPGHCLATGIVDARYAEAVATGLMEPDLYSGWGVRTLSSREKRYNPMSYHNGSVWPHDTSLAAMGLAGYGFTHFAAKICEDMFEASSFFDLQRMPELFCGFERKRNEAPILYPVACSPQAWAVASVYLILGSLLGIEIDAVEKTIKLRNPALPKFLHELNLEQIPADGGTLGLRFLRYGPEVCDVGVEVIRKPADWSLVICK